MHVATVERQRTAFAVQQGDHFGQTGFQALFLDLLEGQGDGAHDPVGLGGATGDVDHRGLDAGLLEQGTGTHGFGHGTLGSGDAAVGSAGTQGQHGGGSQLFDQVGHGDFGVALFGHHAVATILGQRDGTFDGQEELALEVLGNVQHVGVGVVAFTTHDGRMVLEADDLQQHISDGGVDVVQQRH